MAREKMQRELTVTTCKVSRVIVGDNGLPTVEALPDEIIIGGVTPAQATKVVQSKYSEPITIYATTASTDLYELELETFLAHATKVIPLTDEEKAAKKLDSEAKTAANKATKDAERVTKLTERLAKTPDNAELAKKLDEATKAAAKSATAADKAKAAAEKANAKLAPSTPEPTTES